MLLLAILKQQKCNTGARSATAAPAQISIQTAMRAPRVDNNNLALLRHSLHKQTIQMAEV